MKIILMSKTQIIAQVRKLIAEADIKQALEVLVNYVEKEKGQFEDFTDSVIQLQAQFNKTKIEEVKGIISANDAQLRYNQLNQKVLDLLELLSEGKPARAPKPANNLKRMLPYAIALVAVGIIIGSIWVTRKGNQTPAEDDQVVAAELPCPTFEPDSAFKILLLPFRPLAGELQNTHLAIQERFGDLQNQWKINTDTEVLDIDATDNKIYPGDYKDASKMANTCAVQLVIWGTTETPSDGNTITRTRFKFLESGDRFAFKRLNIKEGSQVDTVSSLSLIAAQGVITERLENMIRLIFGLVAHEMDQSDAVIDLLAEIDDVDEDTTLLIQQMALADSYLSKKDSKKALESYNKVLEVHPNYGLALNNRGMLHLQEASYAEATEDFSRNLALDSTQADNKVLVARSEAYLKSNHLAKAKDDLNKAAVMKPDDPIVKEKLKEVEDKIEEQKVIKKRAENLKQARRSISVNEEVDFALSSQKLGEYDQAILEAEGILKRSPKNAEAFGVLMESYHAKGDTAKAREVWERARRAGVDQSRIQEWTPLSRSLMKDRKVRIIESKQ